MTYKVAIRMNNIKHAFPGELCFAFPSGSAEIMPEVIRDNCGGNTSASVVVWDESTGRIMFHLLVDAGMGIISSLAQEERLSPKRIDMILITHGHIDHHSELVYACKIPVRLKKRKLGELTNQHDPCTQPVPIPIYAPERAAKWLGEIYSFTMACPDMAGDEEERKKLESKAKNGWIYPINSLYPTNGLQRKPPVNEGPDKDHQFVITPVGGVKHANGVIYMVEFGLEEQRRKIVFAWDMECLPWSELVAPVAVGVKKLLSDADLMFVGMKNCLLRTTGHVCYDQVKEFVSETHPESCYIVHYSGFEDRFPKDTDIGKPLDNIMCLDQLDDWLKKKQSSDPVLAGLQAITSAKAGEWYPAQGWTWQ